MKNQLTLFVFILAIFSFQSCVKDTCEREVTYIKPIPVYKQAAEFRIDIKVKEAQALKEPGKIYLYNNYIFINEIREGIHVIDNSDPENPLNIAYVPIPGNVDMAVKDGILYADNYTDLVTLDVSTPSNPQFLDRTESVFPLEGQDAQGVLVYYEYEEVTEILDCHGSFNGGGFLEDDVFINSSVNDSGGSAPNYNASVGGSMARFTIMNQYLYTVDAYNLRVFDLSSPNNPTLTNTSYAGWNVETIFPYGNYLYLGSSNGMHIHDVTDPLNPQFISSFWHPSACDPVFVTEKYAYVTLRSGTFCDGFTNELDVIDINDIYNPLLVKNFAMDNPHGLSVKDNTLFLCEGDFGMKVFDVENPLILDTKKIADFGGFSAYDVIAMPGNDDILLVIGDDGFYQFRIIDNQDMQQLSIIPVEK